jgi:hypothetical protein
VKSWTNTRRGRALFFPNSRNPGAALEALKEVIVLHKDNQLFITAVSTEDKLEIETWLREHTHLTVRWRKPPGDLDPYTFRLLDIYPQGIEHLLSD